MHRSKDLGDRPEGILHHSLTRKPWPMLVAKVSEDSMSSAGSVAGSTASWSVVGEGQGGETAQPRQYTKRSQREAPIPERDPWHDGDEAPQGGGWSADGIAPATQAANKVLDSKQKQSTKLAQHKARSKHRGHKGVRWTQMSLGGAQKRTKFPASPVCGPAWLW